VNHVAGRTPAGEFRLPAALAHRVAATQLDKGDHLTEHEQTWLAMEHSAQAHQASQQALQKSATSGEGKQAKNT
jgi:hypothetical protein